MVKGTVEDLGATLGMIAAKASGTSGITMVGGTVVAGMVIKATMVAVGGNL